MDSADEEDLVGSELDFEDEWEDVEDEPADQDPMLLVDPLTKQPAAEDDTGEFLVHLEGTLVGW
jgi:hypothetical protein